MIKKMSEWVGYYYRRLWKTLSYMNWAPANQSRKDLRWSNIHIKHKAPHHLFNFSSIEKYTMIYYAVSKIGTKKKKSPVLPFDCLYVQPRLQLLRMTLPSHAVLCMYTATDGSNAIWSGHVWFKTASGAAFCYSSLGSEIKCLTVMEKKRIT